jgi:hypothetical protein
MLQESKVEQNKIKNYTQISKKLLGHLEIRARGFGSFNRPNPKAKGTGS